MERLRFKDVRELPGRRNKNSRLPRGQRARVETLRWQARLEHYGNSESLARKWCPRPEHIEFPRIKFAIFQRPRHSASASILDILTTAVEMKA